jgi:hypothetical protein
VLPGIVVGMPTIQRDALHAFVDRQLLKIASTPIPPELTGLGASERLQPDEIQALWFGAGIASQIGMVLAMEPGTFVEPWPVVEDDQPEPAVPPGAPADSEPDSVEDPPAAA